MSDLGIAMMHAQHPDFVFSHSLHDGLFYIVDAPSESKMVDKLLEAKHTLDNLPYKSAWGWEPTISFPWDAAYGTDWGHMEEV